jgi:hypothetical protein
MMQKKDKNGNNGNGTEGASAFDFSHLFATETIEVKLPDGTKVFDCTVREVTHGEKSKAQGVILSQIDIPTTTNKRENQRQMSRAIADAIGGGATLYQALIEEVIAIRSWTLKTKEGEDVPVCLEAWTALPVFLAAQIEGAIERINPSLDDEFPD